MMLLDKYSTANHLPPPGNVPTLFDSQIMLWKSALMISVLCDTWCAATVHHMYQVPGLEFAKNSRQISMCTPSSSRLGRKQVWP